MKGAPVLSVFVVVLVLAGCAGRALPQATGQPSDAPSPHAALEAQAVQEIRRAAAQGALWLHTESYLAEARRAHAAGDLEKAAKLAQRALQEALLAQKQAADNAGVKADFTFRQ